MPRLPTKPETSRRRVSQNHAPARCSVGRGRAPSTSTNLVCRLIQIALALYLIPAFLIVLLVGAVANAGRWDGPAVHPFAGATAG